MKEPFAKPPTYRYAIPINDGRAEGEQSVTVAVVTVSGWSRQRTATMRRWLKREFDLTRKECNLVLRVMGFDDLFQCVG